jgi:hypothetical protein
MKWCGLSRFGDHGSTTTRTGYFDFSFSFGDSVMASTFGADEIAVSLPVCIHFFPERKPISWFLCEAEEFFVFKPSLRGMFGRGSETYQYHKYQGDYYQELETRDE